MYIWNLKTDDTVELGRSLGENLHSMTENCSSTFEPTPKSFLFPNSTYPEDTEITSSDESESYKSLSQESLYHTCDSDVDLEPDMQNTCVKNTLESNHSGIIKRTELKKYSEVVSNTIPDEKSKRLAIKNPKNKNVRPQVECDGKRSNIRNGEKQKPKEVSPTTSHRPMPIVTQRQAMASVTSSEISQENKCSSDIDRKPQFVVRKVLMKGARRQTSCRTDNEAAQVNNSSLMTPLQVIQKIASDAPNLKEDTVTLQAASYNLETTDLQSETQCHIASVQCQVKPQTILSSTHTNASHYSAAVLTQGAMPTLSTWKPQYPALSPSNPTCPILSLPRSGTPLSSIIKPQSPLLPPSKPACQSVSPSNTQPFKETACPTINSKPTNSRNMKDDLQLSCSTVNGRATVSLLSQMPVNTPVTVNYKSYSNIVKNDPKAVISTKSKSENKVIGCTPTPVLNIDSLSGGDAVNATKQTVKTSNSSKCNLGWDDTKCTMTFNAERQDLKSSSVCSSGKKSDFTSFSNQTIPCSNLEKTVESQQYLVDSSRTVKPPESELNSMHCTIQSNYVVQNLEILKLQCSSHMADTCQETYGAWISRDDDSVTHSTQELCTSQNLNVEKDLHLVDIMSEENHKERSSVAKQHLLLIGEVLRNVLQDVTQSDTSGQITFPKRPPSLIAQFWNC